MRIINTKIIKDDNGQMILIMCLSIAVILMTISIYEYSAMMTGEGSINKENSESTYFYINVRDRYENVYNDEYLNLSKKTNITTFEKEVKEFALLHGYSVNFIRNDTSAKIIFIDKDMRIIEQINR